MKELKLVRIAHQEASVSIRGKFSLTCEERILLYGQLKEYFSITEALILSTCNRTEVYYTHELDLSDGLIKLLCSVKGLKSQSYEAYFISETENESSLQHLFRVAMGLESQVLGDNEIYGQIKKAYQESTEANMAGPLIHRALHHLFYTHKNVCKNTCIKEGAASVSYNVVNVLDQQNIHKHESNILVVGAGKMGSDVCRHLIKKGYSQVSIANRSLDRSLRLHLEIGVNVLPFEELFSQLEQYDAIISAVTISSPLFSLSVSDASINKKVLAIDLCSPASFTSDFLGKHTAVYFDIDTIGKMTEATLEKRKLSIPKVEKIIEEELINFGEWLEEYDTTRNIKIFKDSLEVLRKQAVSKYLKKADKEQAKMIDEVSASIIKKIVKLPALQLKYECPRHRADLLGQTLNELFNLEYQPLYNLKKEKS